MKALLSAMLIVLSMATALAQSNPESKVLEWEAGCSNCDEIFVDGLPLRIIKNNGVDVGVVQEYNGDYFVFFVVVRNSTDRRFNIDPADASMFYTNKDWRKRDIKGDDFKESLPVPPEKAAENVLKRKRWANIFGGILAGFATTTQTVYVNGRPTTITTPDYAARARAANANRAVRAQAESRAASITSSALRKNTIFPNDSASGAIFFKKEKLRVCYFFLTVDGVDYKFGYKDDR